MKNILKSNTTVVGLAMFSMFFGAGNIIFPLKLGQEAGNRVLVASIGFVLTAISVPFLGLIAMILFDGDYKTFFCRLGNIPGKFFILLSMLMLGPFIAIPRCITLSYSTFVHSCGQIQICKSVANTRLWLFSIISCILIFLFTYRKTYILKILGYVLTPLLLSFLIFTIIKGLVYSYDPVIVDCTQLKMFICGLTEGYYTLDLPAAYFFSAIILICLKKDKNPTKAQHLHSLIIQALKSSVLAAALLLVIYVGMCFVASFHGSNFTGIDPSQLLSDIAISFLGPQAGILASLVTAFACLTTAISLTAVFAEVIHEHFIKMRYTFCLTMSLILTFVISLSSFQGIYQLMQPIIIIVYPTFIALAVLNIAYKLFHFKPIKIPSCIVFLASLYFYFKDP